MAFFTRRLLPHRWSLINFQRVFTTLWLVSLVFIVLPTVYFTSNSISLSTRFRVQRIVAQSSRTKPPRAAALVLPRLHSHPVAGVTSSTTISISTSSASSSSSSSSSSASTSTEQPTCLESRRRQALTIVSGYINLGSFKKGRHAFYTEDHYKSWMKSLGHIENPMVFYTDDVKIAKLVTEARSRILPCTRVHVVERNKIWGFNLVPNITQVIQQPGYPKLTPNTVIPEYAAVMHAKFSMLEFAMDANDFNTEYYAWMDSGLFRSELTSPVRLVLPPGFNKSRIAANQIERKFNQRSAKDIFYSEWYWFVGGGLFIGEKQLMRKWCKQYREFTEYFLQLGLSNSDQQVIYGMFTDEMKRSNDSRKPNITVELQRYVPAIDVYAGSWYHLRWLILDEGTRTRQRQRLDHNVSNSKSWASLTDFKAAFSEADTSRGSGSPRSPVLLPPECKEDTTVVTGYFSFGTMAVVTNENEVEVRDSGNYGMWMASMAKVRNPIVAYFDCPVVKGHFLRYREKAGLQNCTRTKMVDRKSLWSWRVLPWLTYLLRNTSNSHIPEYLASLHSKYALLKLATENNVFNTTYFAWLDASLARAGLINSPNLAISVPQNKSDSVGFYNSSNTATTNSTDGRSKKWCHFWASTNVIMGDLVATRRLSEAYRHALKTTLGRKQLFTDEALINAIYCDSNLRSSFNKTVWNLPKSHLFEKEVFLKKVAAIELPTTTAAATVTATATISPNTMTILPSGAATKLPTSATTVAKT